MKVFDKNKYKPQLSVLFGAVVAPVVNTGLFCLCMLVFYKDVLMQWAGGQNTVLYMLTGLAGINFLVELGVNLVCAPAIISIVRAVKKMR